MPFARKARVKGTTLGVALLGGGARAAYQVGVLARVAERFPRLSLPLVTGVSAGAANAVAVAGFGSLEESVSRLRAAWKSLDPSEIFDSFPGGWEHSAFGLIREILRRTHDTRGEFQGLFNDRPIRAFVSRCLHPSGIRANLASGGLEAVALTASSYETGQSVTFFEGRTSLEPWSRSRDEGVAATLTLDHVMASGAIPLLFPPVRVGNGLYGDGNVRQLYPLSPLVHLGADRILIIDPGPSRQSVRARGAAQGGLAETLGILLDSMVVDRIESDVARLKEINAALAAGPGVAAPSSRRMIDHVIIRPGEHVGALAAGLGPPRCRTLRLLARSAGGWDERVAGLLSYLWVDRRFTDRLFDLGYADARDRDDELGRFLSGARTGEPSAFKVA